MVIGWDRWWVSINFETTLTLGFGYIVLAIGRAAWLFRADRRRRRGAGAFPHYEVQLKDGSRATVRDPLTVAAATYLVPYYILGWWFTVNRHVAAVIRARQPQTRRWRWPWLSPLAFTAAGKVLLLPPLISLARGERRLEVAETAVGLTAPTRSRLVGIIVLVMLGGYFLRLSPMPPPEPLLSFYRPGLPILDRPPFYLRDYWFRVVVGALVGISTLAVMAAYAQSRLNALLARAGRVVPEGPG